MEREAKKKAQAQAQAQAYIQAQAYTQTQMQTQAFTQAQAQFNYNVPQNKLQPVSVPSVSWFTVCFAPCARAFRAFLNQMSLSKNKSMATNETGSKCFFFFSVD